MAAQAINGWLSDPHRVTRFPVMNYDSMDAAGHVNHALLNGLAALKHARNTSADSETHAVSRSSDGNEMQGVSLRPSAAVALPPSSQPVSGTCNAPSPIGELTDIHLTSAPFHENTWAIGNDSTDGASAINERADRWEQEEHAQKSAGPEAPATSGRELAMFNEGMHLLPRFYDNY